MKIIIRDHKNQVNLHREMKRIINQELEKFVGKKNYPKIKKVKINCFYRWTKTFTRDNDEQKKDFELWDEETGLVTLWLAPYWLDCNQSVRYGMRHEMVHLKDVMDNNLIILSRKPFKAKYRETKNKPYKTYTKVYKKTVLDEKYEQGWDAYVDYLAQFFPWERQAHHVPLEKYLK